MYCYKIVVHYTIVGSSNATGKVHVNTYDKSNVSVSSMQTNMDSL